MLNRTIQKLLGSAAIVLTLAACGDNPSGSTDTRGVISFTYSGAISGQFEADGEYRPSGTIEQSFGAATRDQNGLTLVGSEAGGNSRADVFVLNVPARRGTVTCRFDDATCSLTAAFVLGFSENSEETDGFYAGYEGTVTVSELTQTRARGTFSLKLDDFEDFTGNAPPIEVRSGTFDVPIVTEDFGTGSGNRAPVRQLERARLLLAR